MTMKRTPFSTRWSELVTAAEDAEYARDYFRAEKLWRRAFFTTTLTINRRLAETKADACRRLFLKEIRR